VADPEMWNRGKVGSGVWEEGYPEKFVIILSKNIAFCAKIFTCFEMHPVNRGRGRPLPP